MIVNSEQHIFNEDTQSYVPEVWVDSEKPGYYSWDTQLWQPRFIQVHDEYEYEHLAHLAKWRKSDLVPLLTYDEHGQIRLLPYLDLVREAAENRFHDLMEAMAESDEAFAAASKTGRLDIVDRLGKMHFFTARDVIFREIILSMDGAKPEDSAWADED